MSTEQVNAYPKKEFFLRYLVRDISLEDCIMDLVDNAVDSLIRRKKVNVSERILYSKVSKSDHIPYVRITLSNDKFEIVDNCGGISRQNALNDTFLFGHEGAVRGSRLGVYGIGMKRALFKIGRKFAISSVMRMAFGPIIVSRRKAPS